MAETRHTPGPWEVFGGYLVRAAAEGETATPVADVRTPYRRGVGLVRGESESAANALLIAAAPELLAALYAARADLVCHVHPDAPVLEIVRAAIAKAEGR